MMKTSASRRISSAIASRSASRMVIVTIAVPSGTSGSGSATALGAAGAFFSSPPPDLDAGTSALAPGGRGGLGGFLLFCGRRGLAEIGRTFAVGQNGRDRGVDCDVLGAFGNQNLAKRALIGGFDFHRRLVGFDLGDDVARLDGPRPPFSAISKGCPFPWSATARGIST